MKILVTGGAGFIGSNLVRHLVNKYPDYRIINLDKLTYAGNLESLRDVESNPAYTFVRGDICDGPLVTEVFEEYGVECVIHLAAESHVDRSILSAEEFLRTNVLGTYTLLESARRYWSRKGSSKRHVFVNVSTDEVYGSLGTEGVFTERSPYEPNSPYSASKAGADHLARAYFKTHGLPVVTTHCSNNYGPFQLPEKLIPLVILNALEGKELPVYGKGTNVRDWLYVKDHCTALDLVLHRGMPGETYNIGAGNEWRNIDLVKRICRELDELIPDSPHVPHSSLIRFVKDRPGHDMRYAIDATKISSELGWRPGHGFEEGLRDTIRWYMENIEWCNRVRSGAYREYYERNYSRR